MKLPHSYDKILYDNCYVCIHSIKLGSDQLIPAGQCGCQWQREWPVQRGEHGQLRR
jgi:hypothetical protein